jgi:hypothetical protein
MKLLEAENPSLNILDLRGNWITYNTLLLVFNATFNIISVVLFYLGRKPKKTSNMPKVTEKLHHLRLYTPRLRLESISQLYIEWITFIWS